MTEEPQRQRSPIWIMGCMVLVAWVTCGVYRRQVPPLTTARAVLQVPSATDLGTFCQRPEVNQAAIEKLQADGDIYITLEQTSGPAKLSGTLTATKLKVAPPANGAGPTTPISTETWELTYSTPRPERALIELSTLIAVLEPQVVPPAVRSSHDQGPEAKLAALEAKHKAVDEELQTLPAATTADGTDSLPLTTQKNKVQALQKALTESQVQRLQAEEEWRHVEREMGLNQRLEAAAAKLSAGPVQEAVLQIERQRKLSAELTRLNETEQRLGNVYGDKHPKLLELRQKFEQTLSELGGWDHVLDEAHVTERVQSSLERLLNLKQQHETDLETQLELEQLELTSLSQDAERRVALTAQLDQLNRELGVVRQSTLAGASAGLRDFAVQQAPEIMAPHWSGSLALLMSGATLGGLIVGWMLHRRQSNFVSYEPTEPASIPVMATFTPTRDTQMDLAQRRATRQARLQQAYAS